MTGRGSGRLIHTSENAEVTIGISISASPSKLEVSLETPFYLVITAHILTTPRPDSPIVLMAHLNPFEPLPNRSIGNAKCVSPPSSVDAGKQIEIWPRGWPNYNSGEKDLRKKFTFLTIYPNQLLEVRHKIPKEKIVAARLENGERYRVALTDKALGTWWWCFGDLKAMEGVKFKIKNSAEEEEEGEEEEEEEKEEKEEAFDESTDGKNQRAEPWITGEDARNLALLIEKGEAEFEIA